ncbi:hypothetical protein D3OALGA1CA_2942 [Olavius algarvensis associated proteobacterium Delta 3]|nr:hypothetical protein D3OALGB2SA_3261 [Olavius algarvensis associated proteobacterium Delta 3]CAB5126601.1 hypothetical protein D3OALGA1CA_2942 [Olavius algarvensis associated proteobacterium Delta 3]
MCGRDPYPNYFYCRSCHLKISASRRNRLEEHAIGEHS